MNSGLGYVRVGAAVPALRVGGVRANIEAMAELAHAAADRGCDLCVFPELATTAYTCADLFQQQALLDAAEQGLEAFAMATGRPQTVFLLGAPLRCDGQLLNCAVVIQAGRLLGVVPKTYIPGYAEFYEPRWFVSADVANRREIQVCGARVPLGNDLVFRAPGLAGFCFGVELCEDLWAPVPPSSRLALAGATLLLNLSASNEVVGKAEYRRQLVRQQSAGCLAAYVYCSAGTGESTTDLVFGGHSLVCENGRLLGENVRFGAGEPLICADVDVEFLLHERRRSTTFTQAVARELGRDPGCRAYREVLLLPPASSPVPKPLLRPVDAHPFVPADPSHRRERCREILAIQSQGLATRLTHSGCREVMVGLSGGLDSTLALLVSVEAFARLGLPTAGIHCVTMPGFGTSQRTRGNVERLCQALAVELTTVDIRESCRRHLHDIGHDGRTGDTAYENAQARERTQVLMDRANMLGALVVGTGDLSELALGWCTYNGDHMSMYSVNAGVPKTLVRFLIEYVAEQRAGDAVAAVLHEVLATPISPELLPPDEDGEIAQKTEAVLGPYEVHDFFLYQVVRCGYGPEKVLFLARQAFGPEQYSDEQLRVYLCRFYQRFFAQQFKRSCLPDGPKVGSIALSPRGDWRMPSDATVDEWLARLG